MIDWYKNCLIKINNNKGVLSSPLSSSILIKGLSKKRDLIAFNSLTERTLFDKLEKYPVIFYFKFKVKCL